jgi:hypothetical protein
MMLTHKTKFNTNNYHHPIIMEASEIIKHPENTYKEDK